MLNAYHFIPIITMSFSPLVRPRLSRCFRPRKGQRYHITLWNPLNTPELEFQRSAVYIFDEFYAKSPFKSALGNVFSAPQFKENWVPLCAKRDTMRNRSQRYCQCGEPHRLCILVRWRPSHALRLSKSAYNCTVFTTRYQTSVSLGLRDGFCFSRGWTQCLHTALSQTLQTVPALHLNNSTLSFVHCRFPGLTLNCELSWNIHLCQLRANCERR
jgi:hypothetical protein